MGQRVGRTPRDYTDRTCRNGIIRMSLSRFFIPCVLHRKPMHGDELARAVERTGRGRRAPTEGAIHPVLRAFEEGGCVTARSRTVQGREGKVYALTERGRDAFRVAVEAWMEVRHCLADAGRVACTPRRAARRCPGRSAAQAPRG
jgi:DNA-binding PadR family transcriptional regulator